jgi:hypothetical protein
VKGQSGLYPKYFILDAMEGTPGGTWIVIKGEHPNGTKRIAIGYQYRTKTTLLFVVTEYAGKWIVVLCVDVVLCPHCLTTV